MTNRPGRTRSRSGSGKPSSAPRGSRHLGWNGEEWHELGAPDEGARARHARRRATRGARNFGDERPAPGPRSRARPAWGEEEEDAFAREEGQRSRRPTRQRSASWGAASVEDHAAEDEVDAWESRRAPRRMEPPRAPLRQRWERLADTTRQWAAQLGAARRRGKTSRRNRATRRTFLATRRSRIVAGVLCAAILLLGLIPGLAGLSAYQQTKSGLQHFKNAQAALMVVAAHPFDTAPISQARAEFDGAYHDFSGVAQTLHAMPSAVALVPGIGRTAGSGARLIPLAVEASQAGIIACDMLAVLASRLKDPLNTTTGGLTAADLDAVHAKYGQLRPLVSAMLDQVGALQPEDLAVDPRLGPAVSTLKAKLPEVRQALDDVDLLLTVAPQLLGAGTPANFLVEVMDSSELRPGGGFIGNYGILTLTGGHLSGLHIQDVDLLDKDFRYGKKVIPIPPGYNWFAAASPKWGFRDSNLDADFPTDARYAEQLYKQEGGTESFQGVLAITPWLIQNALRITGPVDVPEFKDTVTADNLIDEIHKYQLSSLAPGPDDVIDPTTGTSLRKRFTGLLFQHFLQKVKDQTGKDMGPFAKLLLDALHTKDLQVYANDTGLERVLSHYHFDSTVEAPAAGDSLMLVDANVVASKINYFLQYSLSERVTLDPTGTATHTTTLTYFWPPDPSTLVRSFPAGYPPLYVAYLRIYVPPGAQLLSQTGWMGTATSTAFGREVWGGSVLMHIGDHHAVVLTWKEPNAATKAGDRWHYPSLLQRQAGKTFALDYSITLPTCGKLVGTPPSGFTSPNPQAVTLARQFTADASFAIDYSCS